MLARHLMMGLGLVIFLLPGVLRADDPEDRAVDTIHRLGAVLRSSNTLPGSPIVLVEFHNTKVTDADLKEIAALKQLQRVGLNATKVTDAGLKELAPLTQLKELYLSWTNLTDEGVKELAPFTQLEKLWLDSTKVTDAGLKELASLKQLKSLRIMTTPVTTEGVQELQKALPQCHIHWESSAIQYYRERYKSSPQAVPESSVVAWPKVVLIVLALALVVAGPLRWWSSKIRPNRWATVISPVSLWLLTTLKSRLGISLLLAFLFALIEVCVWAMMPVSPRVSLTLSDHSEVVQFSPDSKTLVTAGQSNTGNPEGGRVGHRGPIRVWDVDQGVERCVLATDWEEIRAIRVSPDSRLIAAHPAGRDLKIWDANTGDERFNIKRIFWGGIWDCRFSPDGKRLVMEEQPPYKLGSRFWNLQDRQDQGAIEGQVKSMVFAPDGKSVATVVWTQFGKTARILLWSMEGEAPHLVEEHQIAANYDIAVSPSLKTFATVVFPTKPDELAQITLWDMQTGNKLHSFPYGDTEYRRPSLRFSSDGSVLSAHGFCEARHWLRQMTFWDVTSVPREIGSFPARAVLSPDRKWFAIPIDNGVKLLDSATLTEHGILANPKDQGPIPVWPQAPGIKLYPSVIFSPDSKHVVVSGLIPLYPKKPTRQRGIHSEDNSPAPIVRIWDVESRQEVLGLERCTETVFSPDGRTVATLHKDMTVKLWNLPPNKPIGKILAVTLVVWLLAPLAAWGGIVLLRKWKKFIGVRCYKPFSISLVVLLTLLAMVVVIEQSSKQPVPRDKLAQLAQSMKAEEVVALLGKPHQDGIAASIGRYAPDSYAWSWILPQRGGKVHRILLRQTESIRPNIGQIC